MGAWSDRSLSNSSRRLRADTAFAESGLSAVSRSRSAGEWRLRPNSIHLARPRCTAARASAGTRGRRAPDPLAIVFRVSPARETADSRRRSCDGTRTRARVTWLTAFRFSCILGRRGVRRGHSGWKGTGIAAEAVRLIGAEFGIPPDRIGAALGPCIGPCCYDVPEDRAELFSREWGDDSVRRADGKWYLDLARANVSLLEREGVSRIVAADACTSCTDALGSFRREGPQRFTRMLALIGRF